VKFGDLWKDSIPSGGVMKKSKKEWRGLKPLNRSPSHNGPKRGGVYKFEGGKSTERKGPAKEARRKKGEREPPPLSIIGGVR